MPKLKKEPVEKHDSRGNMWTSRDPRTIDDILKGKKPVEESVGHLPRIFEADRRRLFEGAHLERLTWLEALDRHIPFYDLRQLPYLIGFGVTAALSGHIAMHIADPGPVFFL